MYAPSAAVSAESIAPLNVKIENTADLRYLELTSRHHRNYGIEYLAMVANEHPSSICKANCYLIGWDK
jgi:hypothetical protein